jgi:hypothetical protein
MGREAVVGLINAAETEEEQAELWRRVQAGFILAESLPTTPTPLSRATKRIIELFGRKAVTARPMHASCPAKIGGKGGKTLAQWLDPEVYNKHYMDFLQALTDSRWIVRGDPKNSKLIQELRWGGRMFGAFTAEEVDVLWMWIKELNDITYLITPSKAVGAYQKFAGRKTLDRTFPPPLHAPSLPDPPLKAPWLILDLPPIETQLCKNHLLSLLILTAAPFEHLPAHIVKAATPHGMAAIKTLRALYGLLPETEVVAGMDEVMRGGPVGVVEIAQRLGGRLDEEDLLVRTILTLSRAPKRRWWELVGIQTGLVIDVLMNTGLWGQLGVEELMAEIGERCIQVLRLLLDESVCDQEAVRRGFWIVREGLRNAGGRREERGANEGCGI